MAWTTNDLETVETAIRTAMTAGIASVSIGGQQVQSYSLESLQALRRQIQAEITSGNARPAMGLRFTQLVPGGTG